MFLVLYSSSSYDYLSRLRAKRRCEVCPTGLRAADGSTLRPGGSGLGGPATGQSAGAKGVVDYILLTLVYNMCYILYILLFFCLDTYLLHSIGSIYTLDIYKI